MKEPHPRLLQGTVPGTYRGLPQITDQHVGPLYRCDRNIVQACEGILDQPFASTDVHFAQEQLDQAFAFERARPGKHFYEGFAFPFASATQEKWAHSVSLVIYLSPVGR